MPEERANELWIESEWTEARTDDRTKWEVIALCLSPLRVYVMTESIKTMMDRPNEYLLHDCPPGDSCNSSQHHKNIALVKRSVFFVKSMEMILLIK